MGVFDGGSTNFRFICSIIRYSCSSVGTVTLNTTPFIFASVQVATEDGTFCLCYLLACWLFEVFKVDVFGERKVFLVQIQRVYLNYGWRHHKLLN